VRLYFSMNRYIALACALFLILKNPRTDYQKYPFQGDHRLTRKFIYKIIPFYF